MIARYDRQIRSYTDTVLHKYTVDKVAQIGNGDCQRRHYSRRSVQFQSPLQIGGALQVEYTWFEQFGLSDKLFGCLIIYTGYLFLTPALSTEV